MGSIIHPGEKIIFKKGRAVITDKAIYNEPGLLAPGMRYSFDEIICMFSERDKEYEKYKDGDTTVVHYNRIDLRVSIKVLLANGRIETFLWFTETQDPVNLTYLNGMSEVENDIITAINQNLPPGRLIFLQFEPSVSSWWVTHKIQKIIKEGLSPDEVRARIPLIMAEYEKMSKKTTRVFLSAVGAIFFSFSIVFILLLIFSSTAVRHPVFTGTIFTAIGVVIFIILFRKFVQESKEIDEDNETEKELRETTMINQDYAKVNNNLGTSQADLQQYDEEEKELREAIKINPDGAEAHNYLGILLTNLQRYDEAEKEYREAIRIDPDYAEAHCGLGVILQISQRYDEAEKEYREAIRINPDDAEAHYSLGYVLAYYLQRYDEAKKEILKAKELFGKQGRIEYVKSCNEILKEIIKL